MNTVYSSYINSLGFSFTLIKFITLIYIVYKLASFAGILYFTAGFISNIFVYLPIYFIGSISSI